MTAPARLVPRQDPARPLALDPGTPFTLGRDPGCSLCLSGSGISRHHAVVRVSRTTGAWVVCDQGSVNGTYLEGERLQNCRVLSDGDEIRLGRNGPAFLFACPAARPQPAEGGRSGTRDGDGAPSAREAALAVATAPAPRRPPPRPGAAPAAPVGAAAADSLDFEGRVLPIPEILSVYVVSRPRHPHIFSWWLLACLGGLLLLPFPLVFWPLQAGALAGWVVLGSRQDHLLVVTLKDGQAYRHVFASKPTALAHRDGIRRRIGQGTSG